MSEPVTVFEAVGGEPFFRALVDRFYVAVEDDELLRPMYPSDLEGARARLFLFLVQYWGCLLYTSPSPRDQRGSRMPSSA